MFTNVLKLKNRSTSSVNPQLDEASQGETIRLARDRTDLILAIDKVLGGDLTVRPPVEDDLSAKVAQLIEAYEEAQLNTLKTLVTVSMTANEASVSNARVLTSAAKTQTSAQTMSSAAEELSVSIAEIENSLDAANGIVMEVSQVSEAGRASSRQATDVMATIARSVTSASEEVSALSEASEEIGDIVKSIEDIAQQTNLLALNATIEAARAGEAGKGFSVVASEVKALSNQTSQATEDIRSRIEGLRTKMSGIVQTIAEGVESVTLGNEAIGSLARNMDDVDSAVVHVKNRMESIAEVLSQQNGAAREVSSGVVDVSQYASETVKDVNMSADTMDETVSVVGRNLAAVAELDIPQKTLWLAQADHVIWKKRLADMFSGRQSLGADELADHTSCRLGRWYQDQMGSELAAKMPFRQIDEPHRLVHEHGIEAARLFAEGRTEEALASLDEVEKHSKEVVQGLQALIRATS